MPKPQLPAAVKATTTLSPTTRLPFGEPSLGRASDKGGAVVEQEAVWGEQRRRGGRRQWGISGRVRRRRPAHVGSGPPEQFFDVSHRVTTRNPLVLLDEALST